MTALTFANMVRETSTTTSTGSYDLAGAATGYAGFVAAVGDGAVVMYRTQMDNDWEIAVGTVTDAATDTLARTEVLETLVSGTYTKTGATAVDWGPGTKTIDLIGPAQAMQKGSGYFLPHKGQQTDGLYYGFLDCNTPFAIPTNELQYCPYYHAKYAKIDITMGVSTAEAGKLVDIGLYTNDENGLPKTLLESSTGNSLTSTGNITVTTSALYPPGWYYLAYLSNATGTAQAYGEGNVNNDKFAAYLHGFIGPNAQGFAFWYEDRTYASGLVSTATPSRADSGKYWNNPALIARPSA